MPQSFHHRREALGSKTLLLLYVRSGAIHEVLLNVAGPPLNYRLVLGNDLNTNTWSVGHVFVYMVLI